jgi:hypothetical protein
MLRVFNPSAICLLADHRLRCGGGQETASKEPYKAENKIIGVELETLILI